MIRLDELRVTSVTGPTGSPQLEFALPVPDTDRSGWPDIDLAGRDDASTRLDRREAEQLHEYLGEWLA